MTLVLRVGLAAVFAIAAVAKLRDPQGAQRTVGGVGVPASLRPFVAFVLSAIELAVAALLLLPGLEGAGTAVAVLLLSIFLVALTVQYVRGVEVTCACFGQFAATPAGLPTIARNAVLLAVAVLAILAR